MVESVAENTSDAAVAPLAWAALAGLPGLAAWRANCGGCSRTSG